MTSNPSRATAAVWDSVSCGLWLLMHDSRSKHAFMQVISMHCTSTIIIIYLELGLRQSPSARVKSNDWGHLLVSAKAHEEKVFLDDSITKRGWKDWWHGLCYFFAAQIKILSTKRSLSAACFVLPCCVGSLAKRAQWIHVYFWVTRVSQALSQTARTVLLGGNLGGLVEGVHVGWWQGFRNSPIT